MIKMIEVRKIAENLEMSKKRKREKKKKIAKKWEINATNKYTLK